MMCSIDKEDEWTNAVQSSSKPKRKMAGVLTYEMGYLVWDPSPSGKQQYQLNTRSLLKGIYVLIFLVGEPMFND